MQTVILHVTIDRPVDESYAYLSNPENYAHWAEGLGSELEQTAEGWVAQTPQGKVRIEFSPLNDYGVLDHTVTLPTGSKVEIPLRVISNEGGSELIFILFRQPEMKDETFATDRATVERDLQNVKAILESDNKG